MSLTPSRIFSKARAFTLIELLTVIAIIGILATIIIPTVGKVRETARASQCVSNMRQTATALRLYAEDSKGMLPYPTRAAGQDGDVNKKDWSTTITPYLPKVNDGFGTRHEVMRCPVNNYNENSTSTNPVSVTYSMGFGSTGVNSFGNNIDNDVRRNLTTVKNPSMAIFLMEGRNSSTTWKTAVNSIAWGNFQTAIAAPSPTRDVQFWHAGKARTHVAFADASVRGFSGSELAALYTNNIDGFRKAAGL